MVKKILLTVSIAVMVVALVTAFSSPALAKVTGVCSNCHTMHASQHPWPDNWSEGVEGNPQPYLLATAGSSPCVGCHSHSTSTTTYDRGGCTVPVVYYTGGSAPTKYLAGGNFWWVAQGGMENDPKGHNVFLGAGDYFHTVEAPGNTIGHGCGTDNCHYNLHLPFDGPDMGYNLPGKYGCEGCHLNVRHHADDHPIGEGGLVNTIEQGWYRFLSGHWDYGVWGYEDDDWEAGHPELPHGNTDHNEYRGSTSGYFLGSAPTTTAFCKGCHGNFHNQGSSESWIRHPSDAVIGRDDGPEEYKHVGGDDHLYDPLSPVARPTLPDTPGGNVTPGSDMVMCLSCHRPHASPYPDLLRWDYYATEAQGGGEDKGCFYCHTQKNDT